MFNFTDQVVIVSGAAGNLGTAVARAFQGAGAKLVLMDRGEERLAHIFPDLMNSEGYLLANSVDVTDSDAMARTMLGALTRFGRIDALINTVGGFRSGTSVHETPIEALDFLLDLNTRSAFIACRAVIPHFLKQGHGKIVNIAARAALSGGAKMAAYSMSKAAIIRLTESLAAELKDSGVNVNCILPGTIDTPENRQAMPYSNYSHWVKPEAIADVILFLVSDASRAINGAAIPVYGLS